MRWLFTPLLAGFLLSACAVPLAAPDLDYAAISNEVVVLGDIDGDHGSGVVISADGLILTNGHVAAFAENDEMPVQFHDGSKGMAKVIWNAGHGAGSIDLALMKIEDTSKKYAFAEIGTEKLYIGQPVFHIGNPEFLGWTVTWGHISAFHRDLSVAQSAKDVIQDDLSIAPGSSGGGLFDSDGKLIGITNAALPDNRVISFAIPRDTIVQQIALHKGPQP